MKKHTQLTMGPDYGISMYEAGVSTTLIGFLRLHMSDMIDGMNASSDLYWAIVRPDL